MNGMSSTGQDAGDDALVTVAATQFVADGDLAHLGHEDLDLHDDAGFKFVAVLAAEHLHADDLAVLAVAHALGGIADFFGLFAEDGAQQALFASSVPARP